MNNIKETLEHYSQFFELRDRDKDRRFIVLAKEAPEKLKEFVCQVHHSGEFDGCQPNDWIYSVIAEAFDDIQGYNDPEDAVDEVECDPYYNDLTQWLLNPFASNYCDVVIEELGPPGFYSIIGAGQERAKMSIYSQVIDFCHENIKQKDK